MLRVVKYHVVVKDIESGKVLIYGGLFFVRNKEVRVWKNFSKNF